MINKTITIRIDAKTYENLKKLSEQLEQPMQKIVHEALIGYKRKILYESVMEITCLRVEVDSRMAKNKLVAPVVKWVGGKRQILNYIMKYIPKNFSIYYEPFLGGGAVLFELQPQKAVVNDINSELINLYKVIRDNVEELIEDLKKHKAVNCLTLKS
ncbi:D12 class N6 adenine-specific DNA methyltransferase/Ribbon-helix-helix protein, copG family [Thermoanaerobacter sp. YS13]|nr:DNA adenine methylase [Thermoanaerobacter sp. YS13]KHO63213.1 D12 class N6 adenine-specific DNA methyltransferase/Ribbon-helix-helix protein, copG family [Thermoanaerobacter sp. YS13]